MYFAFAWKICPVLLPYGKYQQAAARLGSAALNSSGWVRWGSKEGAGLSENLAGRVTPKGMPTDPIELDKLYGLPVL